MSPFGPTDPPDDSGDRSPAERDRNRGGNAHDSGDLHRLLVESVQDYAIFALDPDGYILSWNAGARHLKGYEAGEIIGKHFSIFYPAEKIAERFPQKELEVAADVGRFEDEGWRIRKDGTRFWANVVITALRDKTGTLVGYAKVTRDLTERKRAEESLRASEERFRLLVQGVKDYAIFMLDADGRIASWNDGAERITGWTAREILGRHFSVFYPREDIAARKTERELEIARAEGKYEEEGWRLRKDGTRFWSSVLITPIRNHLGQLVGYGKVTRDLTERRAAEARALVDARRAAAQEAGRQAAEDRAKEMQSLAEQLRRQATELDERREEAETANRAKSSFLAAMSHELRTPLNAIGGYAELLEMGLSGPITDQQREHLDRIRRSQQHLLGIINDILNFSRIEAGQLTYDIAPMSVRAVLESVTQMIGPQAHAKGIAFEGCTVDARLRMLGDQPKVEQVLLNLLSNAVKFTSAGGRVWLTCEQRGDKILLTVRDTGSGIPEDQLRAIFEPFVQVGRSLTSMLEGTGLGLAISRDLARAMNGEVSVESTMDEGSAFTLTLPAA